MRTSNFNEELLERLEDLIEQLERMSPSHTDTMTGLSLIDVELLKAQALEAIAEALRSRD